MTIQFIPQKVDTSSLQAEEVWTGVTYAVAASMIQEVNKQYSMKPYLDIYSIDRSDSICILLFGTYKNLGGLTVFLT